jgi:RNA polymerase sigma-70 factor (ECF subfamily)
VTVEEVYRRYGEDLLRFVHGAHPHLDHAECEDMLHQAILKAVAHLDQYDPQRGSLRVWVLGILRNEVRQDLRRRRTSVPLTEQAFAVTSREPSVEDTVMACEQAQVLEAALAELSFREREALLTAIRTEGHATTEQTAARLGIAPGSVAVYRQRARERLREALRRSESPRVEGGEGQWRTFRTTISTRG